MQLLVILLIKFHLSKLIKSILDLGKFILFGFKIDLSRKSPNNFKPLNKSSLSFGSISNSIK